MLRTREQKETDAMYDSSQERAYVEKLQSTYLRKCAPFCVSTSDFFSARSFKGQIFSLPLLKRSFGGSSASTHLMSKNNNT